MIRAAGGVKPHDPSKAADLRRTALRLLGDHGHNPSDRDRLTRENCGACVLGGYDAFRNEHGHPTVNYAGWERIYVQAGRHVGPRFRRAFLDALEDDSNPAYLSGLLADIATFGMPEGVNL